MITYWIFLTFSRENIFRNKTAISGEEFAFNQSKRGLK
jgi:hypothetical protein